MNGGGGAGGLTLHDQNESINIVPSVNSSTIKSIITIHKSLCYTPLVCILSAFSINRVLDKEGENKKKVKGKNGK